jgi:hypothetical protein
MESGARYKYYGTTVNAGKYFEGWGQGRNMRSTFGKTYFWEVDKLIILQPNIEKRRGEKSATTATSQRTSRLATAFSK